ncbi:hypothetical protein MESS4_670058 [Mesorhizobium sp. STM 4661]|nr:hypothetical protein MESS4_670058 [Mesorhizobium sp. STM 4661]
MVVIAVDAIWRSWPAQKNGNRQVLQYDRVGATSSRNGRLWDRIAPSPLPRLRAKRVNTRNLGYLLAIINGSIADVTISVIVSPEGERHSQSYALSDLARSLGRRRSRSRDPRSRGPFRKHDGPLARFTQFSTVAYSYLLPPRQGTRQHRSS